MNNEEDCSTREDDSEKTKPCSIPGLRFFILFVATLISALALSCHVAFTLALTCNVNAQMPQNNSEVYHKDPTNSPVLYVTHTMEHLLISSFPIGIVVALIVQPFLSAITMRTQVFVGSLVGSIITLLFPVLYDNLPSAVVYSKILHGMAAAPTVPLLGFVTSRWAPNKEAGLFVGTLSCFSQVTYLFTMGTSGLFCQEFGWRSIFYWHGGVTMIVTWVWFLIYRDSPHHHSRISEKELEKICIGKSSGRGIEEKGKLSPKLLVTNRNIWGILIAGLGNFNGINALAIVHSLIMKFALNNTTSDITIYGTVAIVLQTIFKIGSGIISDKWTCVGERFKLLLFNSLSCGASGVLMIATAFVPVESYILCNIFMVLSQAVMGFNSAGFVKAIVLVSGDDAAFIFTVITFLFFLSTIYLPFIDGAVAPDNTWDEWFWLFIVHGSLMVVTNIVYCILVDGKPSKLTIPKGTTNSQSDSQSCSEQKNPDDVNDVLSPK